LLQRVIFSVLPITRWIWVERKMVQTLIGSWPFGTMTAEEERVGVPDFYQGTELWDFSLVDPDNRRPVDYQKRRALLNELDAGPRAGTRGRTGRGSPPEA
jgi:hypothetical protein